MESGWFQARLRVQGERMSRRLPGLVHVLIISVLVYCFWSTGTRRLEDDALLDDQREYMVLAYNIYSHGVFSDKETYEHPMKPALRREPMYPALLALGLSLSPKPQPLTLSCLRTGSNECTPLRIFLKKAHLLGLLATALGAMGIAWSVFGTAGPAYVAFVFTAFSTRLLGLTDHFMSENLALPLFVFASWSFMEATRRARVDLFVLAGVLFGALLLTRAVFMYFWLVALVVVLATATRHFKGVDRRRVFAGALAFVLLNLSCVGGWMYRNYLHTGEYVFTLRYGNQLAKRAAFTSMNARQHLAAFVAYTPPSQTTTEFKSWITRDFLSPREYAALEERGEYSVKEKIKHQRIKEVKEEMRQVGSQPTLTAVQNRLAGEGMWEIARNPFKHLLATMAMAYKGSFVERGYEIDVNIGLPLTASVKAPIAINAMLFAGLIVCSVKACRAGQWALLLLLLPSYYLYVINAVVTFNITRYNLPMLPLLNVCLGCMLMQFLNRYRTGRVRTAA